MQSLAALLSRSLRKRTAIRSGADIEFTNRGAEEARPPFCVVRRAAAKKESHARTVLSILRRRAYNPLADASRNAKGPWSTDSLSARSGYLLGQTPGPGQEELRLSEMGYSRQMRIFLAFGGRHICQQVGRIFKNDASHGGSFGFPDCGLLVC